MAQPSLSILILTLECRQTLLTRLLSGLAPQITDEVELLVSCDNGNEPIGAKRQRLLQQSTGRYVCFIDDDDVVAPEYCRLLLDAIKANPDCVGFQVARWHDKQYLGIATHSITIAEEGETKRFREEWQFRRWPNHLNPIRATLARSVGFQPWNYGEDRDYAKRLRPLLKTEQFVEVVLYHYLLRSREQREGEIVHPKRWTEYHPV